MNYMIEVGGEIFCKGHNSKGTEWSVGIDKPIEGNVIPGKTFRRYYPFRAKVWPHPAITGNFMKRMERSMPIP